MLNFLKKAKGGNALCHSERIRTGEWLLIALFAGAFLLLSLYTNLADDGMIQEDYVDSAYYTRQITVEIRGAVEGPGFYNVPYGWTVQDAISLAKPTQSADLEKIDLAKTLKRKQKITVRNKKLKTHLIQKEAI